MAMTKGCPQSGEDLRSGGYAGDKDGREGDGAPHLRDPHPSGRT
ncbi:hypothetical protein J2045_004518 [Peteryoungia aggregata LMG 23059]|uniref:Uncharacterized protein n=1 Tax=Peteryoungia aggregata LMG 23059 TaxID=1368425 RepID=A0ABU0GDN0_9HYPH|nr:hypothetical protein [Peteryoungia aggregata LMG 23059]